MPSIAGYSSIMYIKGQYYRIAADPKPVVFTGNIDDISNEDDLLRKAMKVTRNQVSGTLPSDTSNDFLIRTLKYGNDTYLQTAFSSPNGYEYKRIYSGEWTDWIAVDSEIDAAKNSAASAASAAASASSAVTNLSGTVSRLSDTVNTLKNQTVQNLINNVNSLGTTVQNKTTMNNVSSNYTISKTSGKWTLGETNIRQVGNCVYMSLTFNHRKNDDVDAGQNGFVGTVTAPDRLKPLFTPCLVGFWGGAIIMCEVPNDGNLQVRVLAGNIHPRTDNPVPIIVTGMFMVAG